MSKKYDLTFWQLLILELQSNTDIIKNYQNGYYIWGNLKINEKVDFKKLDKAINYFIEKNDSMRTKFCYENGVLKQYFDEYKKIDIQIIDVQDENDVNKLQNEINNKCFCMLESYLFDFKMYRYPNGNGGVLLKIHHAITDGWSIGLAAYEVINYYTGKLVIPFKISFGDYLDKRDEYLYSLRKEQDRKYWEELFKDGFPKPVTFPVCKDSSQDNLISSEKYTYELDEGIINKVRSYCKKNKISLSKFFTSCYAILISKLSKSQKFVLSSVCANRKNIKERLTTGIFLMYIYFVVECLNIKFKDFTKNIDNSMSLAYRHRDYLDRYLNEFINKIEPNRKEPLSNLIISYQNVNIKIDKKDLDYEITGDNSTTSGSFDMVIHVFDIESSNKINLIYDYLISKYDEDYIKELNNKLLEIINQVLDNEEIYIDEIKVNEFEDLKLKK